MEIVTPQHIAIIMDGNRTWATSKGLPKMIGHTEGAKNLRTISIAGSEQGIKYLTLWALSTENLLNRSESELKHLFSLTEKIINYLGDFQKYNVKFNTIGDLTKLPKKVQEALEETKEKTSKHTGMVLTLAINYGGQDEIIRTIKKIVSQDIKPEEVTKELIEKNLDTAGIPDVDLIIRTSDHQRLSGYLTWQSTYAELHFPKIKWPAFGASDLANSIKWFTEQKRNNGK